MKTLVSLFCMFLTIQTYGAQQKLDIPSTPQTPSPRSSTPSPQTPPSINSGLANTLEYNAPTPEETKRHREWLRQTVKNNEKDLKP